MKKLILLICITLFFSCKKEAKEIVVYNTVVQDYSSLFSKEEVQKLSNKIIEYEKQTTNQICVYTIDSIPNNKTAHSLARDLAKNLGVGAIDKKNGLLILISKNNKKMAIATGNETEKSITDAFARAIIEGTILPKFTESQYFEGVNQGLDTIIKKWKQPN